MSENAASQPPAHSGQDVDTEKTRLEIQKLSIDLANAKRPKAWYEVPCQLTPLVSAAIAVAGFWVGIHQYNDQQAANRRAAYDQFTKENETAQREYMKPWLEAQRDTYNLALESATSAINASRPADRKKALDTFWSVFYGKMILVETKPVSDAMVDLGNCFDGSEDCSQGDENNYCLALGTAMAQSMQSTSKMTYKQFAANQFHYTYDQSKPN